MSATEGGSFTLTVETEDSSSVEWYHNGQLTIDIKKYKVFRDGDRCCLKVFNCQYTDNGTVEVKKY